ncbi:MAG: nucleotidyltransferase domain-containing protein [Blautia sp.]|nr:nucleotidyltransferase domain-containing protein [Lachnoclostridium sp.]MCM1211873.1 nucleotidyltransferase domain-containing protein [Blautia sp.]
MVINMSEAVYTINQLKEKLIPIFIDNSIRKAVLFGSYGKGIATKESDIDLLVDSDLKGLRFVGFIEDIRAALDKNVDIFDITHVEKGSKIDLEIARTGVLMYEK